MKTYLECIPCFMNQAYRAAKTVTDNEKLIKSVLDDAARLIPEIPMDQTPPETGALIYGLVSKHTGYKDPYDAIKKENINRALKLYPALKEKISRSKDPLLTALKLAAAGNVIDLGIDRIFDIEEEIDNIFKTAPVVFDYDIFRKKLKTAENILYIGDNAGEGVFDKLLIEELPVKVNFAVRHVPVINDITLKEAELIGIDKLAEVISSGTKSPGTVMKQCSEEFRNIYDSADLVISKGQGNFESLSDTERDIFFILKAKCGVVSEHLNVKKGSMILMYKEKH